MAIRSPLALAVLTFAVACQVPSPESGGARFVDAKVLASGDDYADVEVLTSVTLRHVPAADAAARLEPKLPAGVRVGRVGNTEQLLIQGPGRAVAASIATLAAIDVR